MGGWPARAKDLGGVCAKSTNQEGRILEDALRRHGGRRGDRTPRKVWAAAFFFLAEALIARTENSQEAMRPVLPPAFIASK